MSTIYWKQFVLNLKIDDQLLYKIVSKFLVDNPEKKNIQWETVATEYTKAKNLVIGVKNSAYKYFIKRLQKSYRKTKNSKKNGETKTTGEGETKEGVVRVPENYNTLKEAVDRVHGDDGLTTIVVGKGEHQIDGTYLVIGSAMNIVGEPGVAKEEIVVLGGFRFKEGIQGDCHLQHLTLRQAKECGMYGLSSFTMEDVLVEQCGYGVCADGTGVVGVVGRCTNV